jgi:hypothetical protein
MQSVAGYLAITSKTGSNQAVVQGYFHDGDDYQMLRT